jgi:hypothetical protein
MIYRRTRAADRGEIRRILQEHHLEYDEREPLFGFVAEDESLETRRGTGKLIGFSYAHACAIIDPFICTMPFPALKLFYATIGGLSVMNYNTIVVQTAEENIKLNKELRSLGFEKVENRYAIFKKIA